jgi:hypothetical protein
MSKRLQNVTSHWQRCGLSHRKVYIDQAKPLMTRFRAVALQLFKTKSPDHLLAEAAAPERQMKRTLSLIAASAVTIFHGKSASRAVHDGTHRVQNRW